MPYELSPVLLPFALTTALVFIPWYLVDKLEKRFRIAVVVFSLSFAVWSTAELLRISATTVAVERLWHNVRFIGPAFGSVGYFIFTAVYTNHDTWVQRRRLWLLFVVPTLTMVLVWTNPQHMLVRAAVDSSGLAPFAMTYTPGPWFLVHAAYSYGVALIGTGWIVMRFLNVQAGGYFAKQTVSILISVVIILGLNVAYNIGLTTVEWTPIGGAIWAVIFTVAVLEYRMFDLSPLARDVAVENMESGLLVTNTKGEIVDVNGSGAAALGMVNSGLIGKRLDNVFFTSMEAIEEILATDTRTKTIAVQEDERRFYDVTVSPVSIPSDDNVGQVITFADVTKRVERKRQLEAQKQSLERQNEQLDQFASVVSHDLRNPLSTIDGWLDIADDAITGEDSDLDQAVMALENIEQAHERMDTIVDGLLRLARAGQTVEAPEMVSLSEVAKNAWEYATVDDCELELCLSTRIMIEADRDRLLQVFENLFRNAADHNQSGVTLEVGVVDEQELNADGGDRLGFSIEDDGGGIPEDARADIFNHGYTTDNDGTGLGLSIVRDIVAAHGWRIDATTGDHGGARFEITDVNMESEYN
jgi:PAS domain S-box-containing protein